LQIVATISTHSSSLQLSSTSSDYSQCKLPVFAMRYERNCYVSFWRTASCKWQNTTWRTICFTKVPQVFRWCSSNTETDCNKKHYIL